MIKINHSKKAQAQNEIFTYLMATIVLVLILVYGYRAISSFGQQSEQVNFIQLKTQLENNIRSISSDFGSVAIRTYEIPGKYTALCFAEVSTQTSIKILEQIGNEFNALGIQYDPQNTNVIPPANAMPILNKYFVMQDSIHSGTKKNVFLVPTGADSFFIGEVKVDFGGKPFGCVNAAQGKVQVKVEGLGNKAKISPITS